MTALVLTLVLILVMLAVLVGSMRRLGVAERNASSPDRGDVLDSAAPARTYRPLNRLFSAEDDAFLRRFGHRGRKLTWRLGSARSRVLRVYLIQIRADFTRVWRLAREITPRSSDPEFGAWVAKQWVTFHAALAVVYVRSWLGWRMPMPVHAAGLVNALEAFRSGVRAVVEQCDPATQRTG
jgi:hypothetical protein